MLPHPTSEEAGCRETCICLTGHFMIPHVSHSKNSLFFERDENFYWESREVLGC